MWELVFYTSSAGRQPVRDFIDTELDKAQRAVLRERLSLLAVHGPRMGDEYPKALTQLRGKKYRYLHELRMPNSQIRLFLFFVEGKAVLLHGVKKVGKGRKVIQGQYETALRRRRDWLERR